MKSSRFLLDEVLARAAGIIQLEELKKKLAGKSRLRVKLGIDPTSPHLHIGNALPLWILHMFQRAGHIAVLIIGDFTGQVGDPSERETARRELSRAEVKANERTYLGQIGKILDLDRTEVHHNSEWFSKMRLSEFLALLAHFPLHSAWEREDFKKRLRSGREVHLHEAIYTVLQGYDSVAIRADIEIGGLDQRLNLIAGRELQQALGQRPQVVIMFPYLIGLDGKKKMSKSLGNTINILDTPSQMFGKAMAVPDTLILHYAELGAWLGSEEVKKVRKRLKSAENPRDIKLDVAEAVTRLYHGRPAAGAARKEFIRIFSQRELPKDLPVMRLKSGRYSPLELLMALGAAHSKSEARRLVAGQAVEIDGEVITPMLRIIHLGSGSVVRVGKKLFFKVK